MKKNERLNDALNEIGDDLIRDAEDNVPALIGKKKNGWVKWVGIAAAVLVSAIAIPIGLSTIGSLKSGKMAYTAVSTEAAIDERMEAELAPAELSGDSDGGEGGRTKEYAMEDATAIISWKSDSLGERTSPGSEGDGYKNGAEGEAVTSETDEPGETGEGESTEEKTDEPTVTETETETDTETEPETETETETETEEVVLPAPGQLTAAAWDDNAHYLKWKELFTKNDQNNVSGKFAGTYDGESGERTYASWNLASLNRIEVAVTFAGMPLFDASVVLETASGKRFAARTNRNGVAYVFGGNEGTLTVTSLDSEEVHTVPVNGEKEVAVTFETLNDMEATVDVIELMYVVDVTGSMGDELRYLRDELGNVIQEVVRANPESRVKLALLFYRDEGDEEEFRYVEFKDVTNSADYAGHLEILTKQEAAGGGDYPEALDEALETAISKNWSVGSTKLLFHVFDAPAHDSDDHRATLKHAIQAAAEKGVRICPILASGADRITEYTARSEAILTGGTFVFLTDDSGIGESHLDPELPDAVHEYLNLLMIRLINGYHTGKFAEPVPWNAK